MFFFFFAFFTRHKVLVIRWIYREIATFISIFLVTFYRNPLHLTANKYLLDFFKYFFSIILYRNSLSLSLSLCFLNSVLKYFFFYIKYSSALFCCFVLESTKTLPFSSPSPSLFDAPKHYEKEFRFFFLLSCSISEK